jgi:hypothetical protein
LRLLFFSPWRKMFPDLLEVSQSSFGARSYFEQCFADPQNCFQADLDLALHADADADPDPDPDPACLVMKLYFIFYKKISGTFFLNLLI